MYIIRINLSSARETIRPPSITTYTRDTIITLVPPIDWTTNLFMSYNYNWQHWNPWHHAHFRATPNRMYNYRPTSMC